MFNLMRLTFELRTCEINDIEKCQDKEHRQEESAVQTSASAMIKVQGFVKGC